MILRSLTKSMADEGGAPPLIVECTYGSTAGGPALDPLRPAHVCGGAGIVLLEKSRFGPGDPDFLTFCKTHLDDEVRPILALIRRRDAATDEAEEARVRSTAKERFGVELPAPSVSHLFSHHQYIANDVPIQVIRMLADEYDVQFPDFNLIDHIAVAGEAEGVEQGATVGEVEALRKERRARYLRKRPRGQLGSEARSLLMTGGLSFHFGALANELLARRSIDAGKPIWFTLATPAAAADERARYDRYAMWVEEAFQRQGVAFTGDFTTCGHIILVHLDPGAREVVFYETLSASLEPSTFEQVMAPEFGRLWDALAVEQVAIADAYGGGPAFEGLVADYESRLASRPWTARRDPRTTRQSGADCALFTAFNFLMINDAGFANVTAEQREEAVPHVRKLIINMYLARRTAIDLFPLRGIPAPYLREALGHIRAGGTVLQKRDRNVLRLLRVLSLHGDTLSAAETESLLKELALSPEDSFNEKMLEVVEGIVDGILALDPLTFRILSYDLRAFVPRLEEVLATLPLLEGSGFAERGRHITDKVEVMARTVLVSRPFHAMLANIL